VSVPRGVLAAVVTPFTADLDPDPSLAIPYYRALLEGGCDGLNVLGTTGEAMSLSGTQRVRFMHAIAEALPQARMTVGTGASALGDAIELTRTAFQLRFAAALIIPPFYYRDVDDEGILRYFDRLFARTSPPERSVMLYNFPRMSGVTFHPALVTRLLELFPGVICGVKDSSNALALERELHAADALLAVYPGSEALLGEVRAAGLAGCISGSVCLWAPHAQRAWGGDEAALAHVARLRNALEGKPLIAQVRERLAQEQRNPGWRRSIPPL